MMTIESLKRDTQSPDRVTIIEDPLKLRMIKISELEIGEDRIRKDMQEDELLDLAMSIKKFDLLEPIIVRDVGHIKYRYHLIVGRRRTLAHQALGRREILARVCNELTDDEVIEYHENKMRSNFTDNEDHDAIERERKKAEKEKGEGKVKGSINKLIAKKLHIAENHVDKDQKVYNAFNEHPDKYKNLRDRYEAKKIKLSEVHKIIRADQMHTEWKMPLLPEGKFGVVLCDPVWSTNVRGHNGAGVSGNDLNHLDVYGHSMDNSVLFIWSSVSKDDIVRRVIQNWKFRIKAQFTLGHETTGRGFFCTHDHEYLIMAEKGDVDEPAVKPSSIIRNTNVADVKDRIVYDMIDQMYPNMGRKLTMFSNKKRTGWMSWNTKAEATLSRPRADRHRY
jgi:ParB/RepB/Spo0J family partition protein